MNNFSPPQPGAAMKIWKISNFLYRHKWRFSARLFYFLNYTVFGCIIPPSVKMGKDCCIAHSVGVVMNDHTIIGDRCRIMHNVTLGNSGIVIGNNCFLGTGCVIQGPCRIGDSVRIGANTYVNFDVPSNATVVGVKGRIISK